MQLNSLDAIFRRPASHFQGAGFVFGALIGGEVPVVGADGVESGTVAVNAMLAFSVLPTIVFFSSLMALAYHLGLVS